MLADIGGTHARFAWQAGAGEPIQCMQVLQCHDYAGVAEAALHWLTDHDLPMPRQAAIAVACAVQSDTVKLTNNPWSFSIQALKARLQLDQLVVINDFTALALALPRIAHESLIQLGSAPQKPFAQREPVALLGAGTGLGVSGLLPDSKGGWTPIAGEGGHVSLAVHDEIQQSVWAVLHQRHGHVSAERVLSGQGLVNIHASLWSLVNGAWPDEPMSPAQITDLALARQDPLAVQAMQLFCRWLGSAAGDLALILGARGGVFIGGGIAPRLFNFLKDSDFRHCFEDKGRFANYLTKVPVWVINHPVSPALEGVASLLD